MGLLPGGTGGVAPTPIPPGTFPMPPGFLIPSTAELTGVSLDAGAAPQPAVAGQFTRQGFSTIPAGTKFVAYDVTYTGNALSAIGFPGFKVQFDGTTEPGRCC